MKAPAFWRKGGLLPALLAPAAAAYALAGQVRQQYARPLRLPVPVICVGNLVAGGAGKTPVALSLAGLVGESGRTPVFLTRGYGGSQAGPLVVDPARHKAEEVGDEPLLLASAATTVVARDRRAGGQAALEAGADVVIMDDGFQNPSLAKDLSLLVVDAAYGFGNGRVLPAGPLREALAAGLARADALVLLQGDEAAVPLSVERSIPTLAARLQSSRSDLAGRRLLAFAGIGRPEKFFASLRGLGAQLLDGLAFPDHHRYAAAELGQLRRRAEAENAQLITTEKDLVRLSPDQRGGIEVLPVRVHWEEPDTLGRLLRQTLESFDDG